MNSNTQELHRMGQRLWLDNITRDLLNRGTLARYIAELSVTGLTSNPTIFEHAIASGAAYDQAIRDLTMHGLSAEDSFFELALYETVVNAYRRNDAKPWFEVRVKQVKVVHELHVSGFFALRLLRDILRVEDVVAGLIHRNR